jgi:membrane protease YdiL (CAAX protease family)
MTPDEPGDRVAERLRGFGPVGLLAALAILAGNLIVAPLSAVLVLLWARRSRTPWHEIGYLRPKSWALSLAIGIAFGVAFKLLMKSIVMPALGADPINQAYHYLVGNRAALPGMLFAIIAGAGFGEETVFRGFLFERLGKLLGPALGPRHSSCCSPPDGLGWPTILSRASPASNRPRSSGWCSGRSSRSPAGSGC